MAVNMKRQNRHPPEGRAFLLQLPRNMITKLGSAHVEIYLKIAWTWTPPQATGRFRKGGGSDGRTPSVVHNPDVVCTLQGREVE